MKLVAYLRVSTDLQAEKGFGLEVQEKVIKKWARDNGHKVVLWTRDEGVSGSNGVDTRVGLLDALTAVEAREAQGFVVYRLDRLARDLTTQETTLAALWSKGATVFSVDIGVVEQDDPDDPMKTALRQMIGVFAQLERGLIKARLRAGRRQKKENGGYAYGAPPFGMRAERTKDGSVLVPVESEQATLARIRELRAEGASLRVMAETLTSEGRKPRRSDRWHPQTLAKVVARLDS